SDGLWSGPCASASGAASASTTGASAARETDERRMTDLLRKLGFASRRQATPARSTRTTADPVAVRCASGNGSAVEVVDRRGLPPKAADAVRSVHRHGDRVEAVHAVLRVQLGDAAERVLVRRAVVESGRAVVKRAVVVDGAVVPVEVEARA